MDSTLLVLIVTSLACALIGVFLVLRNMAMISDAIAHSTVLGIVLAFYITKNLDSPLLIVGAGLFGVLTVYAIELLIKTRLVKSDAATGIVFSLFFSVAIILISALPKNVHLCSDMVIMGEVIFAPLNTINLFGLVIPKALLTMGIMLIVNIIFIIVFYKELKLTSFDKEYAMLAGFSISMIYYLLMTLISITAVTAFESVGSILVISFLVAPASSAYLLTKKLSHTILVTVAYAVINSVIGYYIAIKLNVNIAGMCAGVAGITFLLTMLLNKEGLIFKTISRKRAKTQFYIDCLLLHLVNHEGDAKETNKHCLDQHLHWGRSKIKKYLNILFEKEYVNDVNGCLVVTEKGMERHLQFKSLYELE